MKLPLKLEYACRVLVQLAPTFGAGQVRRVEELAERERISANYLLQILNELRTAGLVQSRRGKNGGYLLAKEPASITLAEITRAVEGALLRAQRDGRRRVRRAGRPRLGGDLRGDRCGARWAHAGGHRRARKGRDVGDLACANDEHYDKARRRRVKRICSLGGAFPRPTRAWLPAGRSMS
ncbi:MAG: Rrf2 family transcriptional regulator [Verrucomicrobiales bacterium]